MFFFSFLLSLMVCEALSPKDTPQLARCQVHSQVLMKAGHPT